MLTSLGSMKGGQGAERKEKREVDSNDGQLQQPSIFIVSMLNSPYEPAVCQPVYNPAAFVLSSLLIVGLVARVAPAGSSTFSSLVGSFGTCTASILGIIQVFLQWILFSFNFVLFLFYFPDHLKYGALPETSTEPARKSRSSSLWRTSVALAGLTLLYSVVMLGVILYLLNHYPLPQPTPVQPPHKVLGRLADSMGLLSTILAVAQYAPQIHLTWREGFVGALSIPTMMIQTPGSIVFVLSIAIREGTTWSSWLPYAITGILQGLLLTMCIFWKKRQARLGIDDFGRPLTSDGNGHVAQNGDDERTSLLRS
ncbi:hypothetical protein [Phaffia rhodozyma]|uniref:Cystinosin/ERS1p repeat n=1 Tax=Phaffia rhodozyma TaxID=264483 RepID=A0A0F7SPI7_PHARH|nr:hypothetical protein [Phaffia rhodozyma]